MQKPEVSAEDKLELRAIERRLNILMLPLNQCILTSQRLDSVTRLSLNHAKELVEELFKFLSTLSSDIPYKVGGILFPQVNQLGPLSAQLQYFRQELDFASTTVLSTLAVHDNATDIIDFSVQNKETISLSSLLKASQKLCSMTDITGRVYSVKGRFFILTEKIISGEEEVSNVFEEKPAKPTSFLEENEEVKADKKVVKEKAWKQEGEKAELVIALNLVLNIYVLQIFIADTPKYSFYIDYALKFRYRNASELESFPLLNGSALQEESPFIYHWRSTIEPEAEYELIVWLLQLNNHTRA
eukprot:TRINITY_DN136812_c0_g1_i1.p1 TRINITY_DN136812_c0_g1~~TRINITY_DN136812_c0_g1_i1.p1  ORF type:complete len:300 (-),score=23.08 TRINITY_DN136812_c0_g1_i1:464-1363(-)